MKNILQKIALVYALVCILQSVFFPPLFLGGIDNYLFIGGLGNLAVVFYFKKKWRRIILAFCLFFSWSLVVELIINGKEAIHNLPYLLYFLKWPVILFALMNEWSYDRTRVYLPKIVDSLFLILVGLNLFMVVNPNGMGELLQNVYSPKEYVNFIFYNQEGIYRLSGTQMNPNDNGILFSGLFIYYLFRRPKQWYFTALCVGLLILTQSRTTFLLVAGIAFITGIRFFMKHKNKMLMLISLSIGIVALIGVIFSSRNLQSLFSGDAFVSNSLMIRVRNLFDAIETDWFSSIFGHGAIIGSKNNLGFYIDSELVAIIMQYGWIGLTLWFFILFSLVFYKENKEQGKNRWFFLSVLIVGVSLTNYSFLHGTIGVVIATLLALMYGDRKENGEDSPETSP